MNLEKLVKTSLENFEPEVNPSVWQHIEQGLKNAPVSSDPNGSSAASSAGKTALKSVLNHINPWIWGAGIIAATAVATVLLFPSKEKNDAIQKTESTASTTVIPSTRQPAIENPEEKAETVISYNQPAAMELQNIQKSPGNSPVEENQAVEMVATNTEKKSPVEVADSKVQVEKTQTSSPSTVTSNSNAPASTDKNELSNIEAAPVIILNTQAGFAPLKVTALLNVQEKGNWDFGDGQATLSSNSVTHSFNKPGTYKITCSIGETNIDKTIEVIGSLSTAFTPNGDGVNDEFSVESSQVQELNIKVVDRTGRQVYEITQPGQRWDGKDYTGKNLPEGTYFYNIFARSVNGQSINQKGTISIFK